MKQHTVKTPETHPDHSVVGHLFVTTNLKSGDWEIYYCDSYDPRIGYWLTQVNGTARKNVSERAIGGTFHEIWFMDDFNGRVYAFSRWGSPFGGR